MSKNSKNLEKKNVLDDVDPKCKSQSESQNVYSELRDWISRVHT